MYKIMIHIDTHTNDTWFYYQEEGKDYVANSLEEIRETVLTLIDVYGEDYIKIVKQETGDDMNGSVETFLYDSTDNYEELVNRPFINGVEIVGALSLAELGIQPVGNYATNERVDALEETVNNIDFTPYATNARVDQVEYKVDNIDLTPYATNERVDQVEAKVDAIDLEPYATMDYLDEVVAGIDFSASNENITGVKTFSVLPRSTVMPVTEDELTNKSYVDHEVLGCATEEYVDNAVLAAKKSQIYQLALTDKIPTSGRQLTSSELSELSKICNSILTLNDTQAQIQLYLKNDKYIGFLYPEIEYLPTEKTIYDVLKSTRTKYLQGKLGCATYPANTNYGFFDVTMTITGTYNSSTNQISITKAAIQSNVNNHVYNVMGISKSYLSKTNTSSFTPTSNYHPATKLYVDNAVAKIEIPEVNLDDYATIEYVDDSLANLDVDVETTETVIFSSADTKEQRKEKFFHLVELYNSGKKFNTFFKCNASVSVLGSSFKPAMPLYGFLYDLSFDRSGSYSYKYAMCFLVKYADGSMQSVGDSFAKIELFSESNDPTKGYHEQLVCADNNYCYYLPRKHELITKNYVDTAIANAITTVLEGEY